MRQQTRFINNSKGLLIFLSNLYYSLDCHDDSFQDILTNSRSKVTFKSGDWTVNQKDKLSLFSIHSNYVIHSSQFNL